MNLPPSNCVATDLAIRCSVAVAGAGLAGLAAAIVLAQAGIDVVLIGQKPKDGLKVGESLPGAAIRLLRRIGVAHLDDLLTRDDYLVCTANCASWGSEEWVYKDAIHNVEGGGWHILRHRFEAALLAHAQGLGVKLFSGQVCELACESQCFQLAAKIDQGKQLVVADWLVDGTGRRAWLTRRLAGRPESYSQQFAAVAWLRASGQDQDSTTRIKSTSHGWWYSARLPGNLRVLAFHGLPRQIAQMVRSPQSFSQAANACGILPASEVFQEHLIGLRAHDAGVYLSPAVAGRGWLAVGDAAISFDPLSSQGMFFALYSGIRGAEAILASLKEQARAREFLSEYCARVAQIFDTNERTRRMFYLNEMRYRDGLYWQKQGKAQ